MRVALVVCALLVCAGCGDGGIQKTCDKLARLGAEHRQKELEKIPEGPGREQARKASESVGQSASAECAGSKRAQRAQIGESAWKVYVACVEAAKTSEDAGRCDKP
jgi:hypothetical protein